MSLDGLIEIDVAGKKLNGSCIIVGKNISHSIDTKQKTIFTMLIAPTSAIATVIEPHIHSCGYWICDTGNLTAVQSEAQKLVLSNSIEQYFIFLQKLNEHLNINPAAKPFDPRISMLLQLIENCNCDDHTISSYAHQISLSASRLSHLFKTEVGIPLKSYIMLHQVECAFEAYLNGKSITQAALDAGFDSPSHFSATIKRIMGMPASLSAKDSEFLKVKEV